MGIREECEEYANRQDNALKEISNIERLCHSGYLNEYGIRHYHNIQDSIASECGLVKDDLGYHRHW